MTYDWQCLRKAEPLPFTNSWLFIMNGSNTLTLPAVTVLVAMLLPLNALAQKVTLTLSQEQDGGSAGRACLYIHQGQAEYRLVKPAELCPGTLTIESSSHRT